MYLLENIIHIILYYFLTEKSISCVNMKLKSILVIFHVRYFMEKNPAYISRLPIF